MQRIPFGKPAKLMSFIKPFHKVNRSDVASAGGKGASLGELTQAGFPVPPGFIITSTAFDLFIQEADLNGEIEGLADGIDDDAMGSAQRASARIQALIDQARISKALAEEIQSCFKDLNVPVVAVRSSATSEDGAIDSWAGQLESFLNSGAITLLDDVKRSWASLFSPRAIAYGRAKGIPLARISVAVVVQAMVQSAAAGVAFSIHPLSGDPNQLLIEAGWGLGEALVSGRITPDSYLVDKQELLILDTKTAAQDRMLVRTESSGTQWVDVSADKRKIQKLPGRQIISLARHAIDIEAHYGHPCDVEWAWADSRFFMMQARPITGLKR
jgi:pyruvate,water dikinase